MPQPRDWQGMKEMSVRLLVERTGKDLETWNRRVRRQRARDAKSLRAWLASQGVTGYPQTLLVMERFGYPDFLLASSDALIDGQYADRPQLRPILNALLAAVAKFDGITIQARKTYVSLVTPRRTFARIQATTRDRVDLGLRFEKAKLGGRLKPSKLHETMRHQIGLATREAVDDEVRDWLRRAYEQNC